MTAAVCLGIRSDGPFFLHVDKEHGHKKRTYEGASIAKDGQGGCDTAQAQIHENMSNAVEAVKQ